MSIEVRGTVTPDNDPVVETVPIEGLRPVQADVSHVPTIGTDGSGQPVGFVAFCNATDRVYGEATFDYIPVSKLDEIEEKICGNCLQRWSARNG